MSDAGLPEDFSHYPHARPVHVGWSRDVHGYWVSAATDDSQWEVVCPQCGDTDGPVDGQSESTRALRGPYSSKRKARRVAKQHARHNREPPPSWGAFPTQNFPSTD